MAESNLQIAQQTQQKFEFYLLGLIFTILGLSIQTAKFGASGISDALELIAWSSLLVSAIAGLSRMEWTPTTYLRFDLRDTLNAEKNRLVSSELETVLNLSSGLEQPVSSALAEIDQGQVRVEDSIKMHQRKMTVKYQVQKWSFLVGITLLVLARAYPPLLNMYKWSR